MAEVAGAGATVDRHSRRGVFASVGALGAAILASLCCTGPLLFVTLGVGAGLASRFEPLRPLFTIMTLALLGFAFVAVYRRRPVAPEDCGPDGICAVPRNRMRDRIMLWTATILAASLLTFPEWSVVLL